MAGDALSSRLHTADVLPTAAGTWTAAMDLTELAGRLASAFKLGTFVCWQGRRLRMSALAANLAFITYGAMALLWPVRVLHAMLIPINAWRLAQLFDCDPRRPRKALYIRPAHNPTWKQP